MAIDIIARGLATSLVDENGKIAANKMPIIEGTSGLTGFFPVGKLTDASMVEGKTAEELLLMMLFGIVNPALEAPAFSAAFSADNEQPVIGRPTVLKGALTFNRGKIDPAYGTSGYRAGAPVAYSIGDQVIETSSTSYDFEIPFTPVDKTAVLECAVRYGAGEQPMNSIGQPYGAPLSAGSLTSSLLINAVYPIYAPDGTEYKFTWIEEENGDEAYAIEFASELSGTRQSFVVPSQTNVKGVKAFNALTQQWEWLGGYTAAISLQQFTTKMITIDNNTYIQYTYASTPTGARELRIYVE